MTAPIFIEQKPFAGLGYLGATRATMVMDPLFIEGTVPAPERKEISEAEWTAQVEKQWVDSNPAIALELKAQTKGAMVLGGGLLAIGIAMGASGSKPVGYTLSALGGASLIYGAYKWYTTWGGKSPYTVGSKPGVG